MRKTLINILLSGILSFSYINETLKEDIDGKINPYGPNQKTQISENEKEYAKDFLDYLKERERLKEIRKKELEKKVLYEGGFKLRFLNENKIIKIPTWKQLNVTGPDMCSQYANRLTLKMGYRLENSADTWDLHKYNPSVLFLEDSLKIGDLITFYNPTSQFRRKNRESTHTVVYLGKDDEGKNYCAEQRGSKTKISTIDELIDSGMKPIRIIKTEKIELDQNDP